MFSAACGDDVDALIYFVNGLVDVSEGALLQALREGIILFASDILMRLLEKLLGPVQTACVIETGIHRRMVVQILAVIDRSSLDLVNGVVDCVDCFFFFVAKLAAIVTFQVRASRAKIAERVQVSGMLALSRKIS